jgi:hypothetical protein
VSQQEQVTEESALKNVTRRSFVSTVASGVAVLGALGSLAPQANAQLVWKTEDWKLSEFHSLVKNPAQIKQLFDVTQISEGRFLVNMKNSLNGLHFGFGVPADNIKIVGGLHGPANLLNYDDFIWKKYRIGAWLNVNDPDTGKPALRNPFYLRPSTLPPIVPSQNPDDPTSQYQDSSMRALQSRGVQFLSCHTALEEQVRALIKHSHLTQEPEPIVREMLAHTVPGVLVVASMVAAVALLQCEGHYSYISIAS